MVRQPMNVSRIQSSFLVTMNGFVFRVNLQLAFGQEVLFHASVSFYENNF